MHFSSITNSVDFYCYVLGDDDAPNQFIDDIAANFPPEQRFETPTGQLFTLPLHVRERHHLFHYFSLEADQTETAQVGVQQADALIVLAETSAVHMVPRVVRLSAGRPVLPILIFEGHNAFDAVPELQLFTRFARPGHPIDVMKRASSALINAFEAGSLTNYAS